MPSRLDTDTEAEQEELENLGDLDGDGPGDIGGLQVYSAAKHFTNIESLDSRSHTPA